LPDTIITKRFNRRRVAQSYDYEPPHLAEELDQIELKPEVEAKLGEKSATIAANDQVREARAAQSSMPSGGSSSPTAKTQLFEIPQCRGGRISFHTLRPLHQQLHG